MWLMVNNTPTIKNNLWQSIKDWICEHFGHIPEPIGNTVMMKCKRCKKMLRKEEV